MQYTSPHPLPNCFYRISLKALILDDQKRFLLTQEDNGKWELPGGGLDWGENHKDCIKREVKEEMGLETTFIADNPSYFVTSKSDTDGKMWFANVVYIVKTKHLNFTPSDECVAIKFFTKEEALKANTFSNISNFAEVFDPKNH